MTKEKVSLILISIFMILIFAFTNNLDFEDYKKSYSYYLEVNELEDTQANYLIYLKSKEV